MMKKFVFTLIAALATVCAYAAAPNSSGTYYQNANGKKGSALKTALCGIIYNRTEKSYDYLWTAFYTTDVRPAGDSNAGKIWDMYSNITNYTPVTSGSTYSKEGDCYNREHSWPQSWFGSNAPMYTDLHHIYPTDGKVNGMRANYPFGETTGNTYKSANNFSKLGTCTVSGYTGTVFEPADEYKGDFARTYFYMVTCYEEKLPDWYTNYSSTDVVHVIDGSTYPGFQTWQLNMLLKWAKDDPVSEKEVARNTAVKEIQGNRNPFIDYPGLEQYIWGSKKGDTFSYDNYVQPTTWSTEYNSGSGSGGGGDSGTDVIDALTVTGWANYTDNSFSAAETDKTGTGSTTGVSYAMQVYNGSTGAVRGNQSAATSNFSCRNTSTYEGYYIKEVKLAVTGGTIDGSTSGRSEVYFGTSVFTTSPTGTATVSTENASGQSTLTWTNDDTSNNYFILYNLKTSGTATSAVVTVTWGSLSSSGEEETNTPQETEVDITFGNALYGTSYTGANAANNGPFEGSVSNVGVAVAQGSGANLYVTDSETRIYGGTPQGTITITAPTGYLLTEITITKGSSWSVTASPGTLSTATWTGAASNVVFSASARSDFRSAKITLAPAVTITSAGYATYASDHALDFTSKTIKAYIATVKGDKSGVNFTQVNKVPANTGVLLYKDGGATEAIPVFDPSKTDPDVTTGNVFVKGTGVGVATDDGTNYNYILNNGSSGIGFYRANSQTVATNRAYISIPKVAGVKEFIALSGFDADGISATRMNNEGMNNEQFIFNLAGQRLNRLQKGINIVNGKKVLVK